MKFFILVFVAVGAVAGFVFENSSNFYSKEKMADKKAFRKSDLTENFDCSDGWRITGYFTPIETDYDESAGMREIEIKDVGAMSFNAEFLRTVFDEDQGWGEGWGKTRFGWYLGNYDGAWHKADAPLNSNNQPLQTNSVAVDNSIIPYDSIVQIPGLPDEYGEKSFIANDVGVTVHGKHIDVYTGEGKEAERKMYRVTFEDDNLTEVCYKKP